MMKPFTVAILILLIAGCHAQVTSAPRAPRTPLAATQSASSADAQPAVIRAVYCGTPPGQQSTRNHRRLNVNGIASMEVTADLVDVTIGIEVKRWRPQHAVAVLKKRQKKLLAALAQVGVEQRRITLRTVNLTPSHRRVKPFNKDGYVASSRIVVVVKDMAHLGRVLDAAIKAEVTHLSTRSRNSRLSSFKKKVRERALVAAKEKAKQIARTLGFKLGPVVTVGISPSPTWRMQSWNFNAIVTNNALVKPSGQITGLVAQSTLRLSLTTHVSYEIL